MTAIACVDFRISQRVPEGVEIRIAGCPFAIYNLRSLGAVPREPASGAGPIAAHLTARLNPDRRLIRNLQFKCLKAPEPTA